MLSISLRDHQAGAHILWLLPIPLRKGIAQGLMLFSSLTMESTFSRLKDIPAVTPA